jgi:hypothetical protein
MILGYLGTQKLLQDWALMLLVLQTSNAVTIFTPHSLGTSGQLNHTRSTSLSDPELQYDQASAVLPVLQRKYSNAALSF